MTKTILRVRGNKNQGIKIITIPQTLTELKIGDYVEIEFKKIKFQDIPEENKYILKRNAKYSHPGINKKKV